ncbi:MAG: hypothetical protein ABI905_09740 [Betaproteobacteria bacterium]
MKSQFKSFAKDNVATGAVLAAMFIATVGAFIDGNDAWVDETSVLPMQHMAAITVTAPRDRIIVLDAIIVTAAR